MTIILKILHDNKQMKHVDDVCHYTEYLTIIYSKQLIYDKIFPRNSVTSVPVALLPEQAFARYYTDYFPFLRMVVVWNTGYILTKG